VSPLLGEITTIDTLLRTVIAEAATSGLHAGYVAALSTALEAVSSVAFGLHYDDGEDGVGE
jgi:hypothetical protein